MSAEIVELIRTDECLRGRGVDTDPMRRVTQYWTKEGELLWERDPCAPAVEELQARVNEAVADERRDAALLERCEAQLKAARRRERQATEQLTRVQARCTEQLKELRRLRQTGEQRAGKVRFRQSGVPGVLNVEVEQQDVIRIIHATRTPCPKCGCVHGNHECEECSAIHPPACPACHEDLVDGRCPACSGARLRERAV